MATEDMSKKDPVKLIEEQLKLLKQMLGKLDEQLKFQKKMDKNITPGARKEETRAVKNAKYLQDAAKAEKGASVKERLSDRLQVKQRQDAFRQLKLIAAGAKKNKSNNFSGMPVGSKELSGMSVFKKFNLQMKNISTMINPKGVDKKKAASETANAMKGMMKFAVGGSIVGMLGKKLFDSSPLLKTMMSLFNTSVMLIFRPIGDFIGSFLRPIMMFFMKNIAIPFYKNSKHAMGLGEQYGKRALGFLLKPAETMYAMLVSWASTVPVLSSAFSPEDINRAKDYDGVAHWQLDQLKAAGMDPSNQFDKNIAKHGWTHMKGLIADVWTGGKEKQGGGKMWGTTPGASSMPGGETEEYFAEIETNAEASANHMTEVENFMARALLDGQLVESEWDELSEIMGRASMMGIDIKKSIEFIKQQMEESAAKLSAKWVNFQKSQLTSFSPVSTNVGQTQKEIDIWNQGIFKVPEDPNWGMVNPDLVADRVDAPKSRHASDAAKNLERQINATNSQTVWNRVKDEALSGRFAGKNAQETAGLYQALVRGGTHVGEAGQALLNKAKRAVDNGQVKGGNDKEARKHAAAFGAAMTAYNAYGLGEKPQMGDLTNIVNGKPAGSKGYANGGLITEPIFGVGRSGQTYTFGERGQETVTPGKGGTNYILNVNVGNVTREADFEKLKPLIQRWILEANSRRGVV